MEEVCLYASTVGERIVARQDLNFLDAERYAQAIFSIGRNMTDEEHATLTSARHKPAVRLAVTTAA
jgi:hypothetical protein